MENVEKAEACIGLLQQRMLPQNFQDLFGRVKLMRIKQSVSTGLSYKQGFCPSAIKRVQQGSMTRSQTTYALSNLCIYDVHPSLSLSLSLNSTQ